MSDSDERAAPNPCLLYFIPAVKYVKVKYPSGIPGSDFTSWIIRFMERRWRLLLFFPEPNPT